MCISACVHGAAITLPFLARLGLSHSPMCQAHHPVPDSHSSKRASHIAHSNSGVLTRDHNTGTWKPRPQPAPQPQEESSGKFPSF